MFVGSSSAAGGALGRFMCACAALSECAGAAAKAEAVACLQQLQMFSPRHTNLHTLVPMLCVSYTLFYKYVWV